MARRAAAGPSYAPHPIHPRRAAVEDKDTKVETPYEKFMREEIWDPEKKAGNLNIVAGLGLFVGGIVAVRTWGDLMIPA
jgi:hypothetical protein